MLSHPGGIVAEPVGRLDFRRHASVDLPVWIGLAHRVGVRGEENPEFHAFSSVRYRVCPGRAHTRSFPGDLTETHRTSW
jgi:hypothetical protein